MPTTRALFSLVIVLVSVGLGCRDRVTVTAPIGVCGGFQGIGCPPSQTCELPAGECQTADLAGVCVTVPELCTTEYDPVCGCDGNTYGNDCNRLMARVQKAYDGEC